MTGRIRNYQSAYENEGIGMMVRMNRSETKVIAFGEKVGSAWKEGYGG